MPAALRGACVTACRMPGSITSSRTPHPQLHWRSLHATTTSFSRPHGLRSGTTSAGRLSRSRVADNGAVELTPDAEVGRSDITESSSGPQLVEAIMHDIQGTDGGIDISAEKRSRVDAMFERLSEIGNGQEPRPLDSPLIYGNYEVSYVSSGKSQQGQPAGGRFRGAIGRAIFQTKGIYQSVLEPDIVTNKVEFALFGLIQGHIALRGRLEQVGEGRDTVKVYFEAPCLCLGGLHLSFGPQSDVQLSTPYLDEQVRLGRGSRGSLFVFKRGGPADAAGMDIVGRERSSPAALAGAVIVMLGVVAGGGMLWQTGTIPGRIAAGLLGMLLAAMCAVLFRGGIVDDRGSSTASSSEGSN